MTAPLRVLCWAGMPSPAALAEAGRRLGVTVETEEVSSNERLEERLDAEPWDVVFPSDYLVARLDARGALADLDLPIAVQDRLAPWAREFAHDPGNRCSVPFAFGTTGYLAVRDAVPGLGGWCALLRPAGGVRVGMLSEAREVVGAALLATGHDPNDASAAALADAEALLLQQRPHVVRFDSDDFTGPVERRAVDVHHAWSSPGAAVARASTHLEYVVPREGAVLWVTTGAVPASAPRVDVARAFLVELADPQLAVRTTAEEGYATPSQAARDLLPRGLRDDPALFPGLDVLARTHTLLDLGPDEVAVTSLFARICDLTPGGSLL